MQRALDEIAAVFDDVEDPYLHERKGDLHDVAGRLRMNLRDEKGGARDLLQDLDTPCVLIADELTPSVVAQLDWTRIRGFATDAGSRTYHTAILARSLGVPAVVGLHDVSSADRRRARRSSSTARPAKSSSIRRRPIDRKRKRASRLQRRRQPCRARSDGPLQTADGVRSHAAGQHRAARRRRAGARGRRRRHRALSIGVHAGRRTAGHGRRGRAVSRLSTARRAAWRRGR